MSLWQNADDDYSEMHQYGARRHAPHGDTPRGPGGSVAPVGLVISAMGDWPALSARQRGAIAGSLAAQYTHTQLCEAWLIAGILSPPHQPTAHCPPTEGTPVNHDPAPSSSSPSAGREAALRELALRLLRSPAPGAPPPHETQLLPGALPPNLLTELPLPPGTRVVGSLVSVPMQIVLDVPLPPPSVLTFYREQLPLLGWSELEPMGRRPGGFVDQQLARTQMVQFTREATLLFVNASPSDDRPTDVGILFRPQMPVGDFGVGPKRYEHRSIDELIPPLYPPPHSRQEHTGGGGTSQDWSSAVALETDLDLASMVAHYEQQLTDGAWMRRGGETCDRTASSVWAVRDPDGDRWRGLLVAAKWDDTPEVPHSYHLAVYVHWLGHGSDASHHAT